MDYCLMGFSILATNKTNKIGNAMNTVPKHIDLVNRNLLTLKDFTKEEIVYLIDFAAELKQQRQKNIVKNRLLGKSIVLLFEKTSTRTRCAFECAVHEESGNITFLGMADSQFGKKESIEDSAKVLSRFYSGIEFRGFDHATLLDIAKHATVPVWNGLTNDYHPTQVLADYLTIKEHVLKPFEQIKFVFVGDMCNNVANSLMLIAAKLGVHFVGIAPQELFPKPELLQTFRDIATSSGAVIEITDNIDSGVKNADVIYGDVWVSMGDEDIAEQQIPLLTPYKITQAMFDATGNEHTIFLHCLPSFHDFETDFAKKMQSLGLDIREVDDDVFRAKYSKVFDEAENRLHTIKAVILSTLGCVHKD